MRQVCHIVSADQDLTRLDTLLAEANIYPSRSAASKSIDGGYVLVDGVVRSKSYGVRTGESVVCSIKNDATINKTEGENIPLNIVFEDDYIGVISKQPGLICHPADEHTSGTLVNALVYRYGEEGLANVQGADDRPGIVHRLDGDTSGLMLFAKDNDTGLSLMESIALKQVERKYLTLVHGIITVNTGLIDAPIMRSANNRKQMSIGDGASAREAVTTFKVLERFSGTNNSDGYTLVECKLYTGRTHQIRVHMQYIGHPVVGDKTYNAKGPKDIDSQLGLDRQFLHSYELGFLHPVSNEELYFKDGLPPDLKDALNKIDYRSIEKVKHDQ